MLSEIFWTKYFLVYDLLNKLIPYQELLEEICNQVATSKGNKILDVGSGTGNLAILLSLKGNEVVGLDYSKSGISLHKAKSPNSVAILGDIKKPFPFETESFDKVVTNNTLYTIQKKDRQAVLKEIYRVLKPGGLLVTSNLRVGFKPLSIYISHVKQSTNSRGFWNTIREVLHLIIPTIKIFYYNYLIKRENTDNRYSFFKDGEQIMELEKAGFKEISQDKVVYAGQAILNTARK